MCCTEVSMDSGPLSKLSTTLQMCSRHIRKSHLLFYLLYLNVIYLAEAQTYRPFPSLSNLARRRPIFTLPSDNMCGIPRQSAFCKSSTLSDSVSTCRQDFCIQECPRRIVLPASSNLLSASNYGSCVTIDTENVRPDSAADSFAAVFSQGALCYIHPIASLDLGANGAFTLTFWIWQQGNNIGTVIEKYTNSRQTIFRLRVSYSRLIFHYRSTFGPREVDLQENLAAETWTFIAIQVYDTSLSYFVNGVGVGYSARGTRGLVGPVVDGPGVVRMGQTANGTDQFLGRIQDSAFFPETLSNREIQEVYSGSLPEVFIQSSCRCPPTHPRVNPLQTKFCIKNGVPDNIGDEVLRLNNNSHPLQYLNDGDANSIWISSFTEDVTITIDLGDQFQVFYVMTQFYSPHPRVFSIERRKDTQSPWQQWQLYADDCPRALNVPNNGPLLEASSVNCLQFGTNGLTIPYSKGNITFNVLSGEPFARPGHNDFYNTEALWDFVMASQVRVRMQGHYYMNHPRHNYFGIYEFIITGRCDCHGHAESCDMSVMPYQCGCLPESYTEGNRCERCKPLYNNKPFRNGDQQTAYNCKPCNCHEHADSCVYDAALDTFPGEHDRGEGGRCVNCIHNTAGRWCDVCAPFYYRPLEKSLYAPDVCSPCECFPAGVMGDNLDCQKDGGQCMCKLQVTGRNCDQCRPGYYNLQASNPVGCEPCFCNQAGSISGNISCLSSAGECYCKANVRNEKCDACKYGYFGLDANNPLGCSPCECHPQGSRDIYCNANSGQCNCRTNIVGRTCDSCADGYFDFNGGCRPCDCSAQGAQAGTTCDKVSGQCICKPSVTGVRCDQCLDGFYSLGADFIAGCVSCGCDVMGTNNQSTICDKVTGDCQCKANVQGRSCNQCKPNTYDLRADNVDGCEPCMCDPSGTLGGDELVPHQLTCDQNTGSCTCLTNRVGLKCDNCALGYYVNPELGGGCDPCACNPRGTILLSYCDTLTGQCQCKVQGSGIGGRACESCIQGYYGNPILTGFCTPCNCDAAGSVNITDCDANTGQCLCKEFTQGLQCGVCKPGSSNLQADNPYGCSKQPSQQPPADVDAINATTLRLYWAPPDYPNGVILRYVLYRNGQVLATLEANNMEYLDTGLTPFTSYTYIVVAENDYGSTSSPAVTFRTPPGPPTGQIALTVRGISARGATLSWTAPPSTNGILQYYELNSTGLQGEDAVTHYRGRALTQTLFNLQPYDYYEFTVSACTDGGCLVSNTQVVITSEAMPESQSPPTVQSLSSTELLVTWEPPENPNGVIIFYELWMRGPERWDGTSDPPASRIFHPAGRYDPLNLPVPQPLPPPATNYTVENLDPFRDYEFQVISQNSIGLAASPWIRARTGETAPESMPTPVIYPLSASTVNVSWSSPSGTEARGEIVAYRVYHYKPLLLTDNPFAPSHIWTLSDTTGPEARSAVVGGLAPYSDQVFMVEACNAVGCVNSSESTGRTLPGVPSGVDRPYVDGYNRSTMYVSWEPASELNGPEPYYIVRRTESALNSPPPAVTRGTRFPGLGYYLFPPETVPQGVGYTGIELWFKTNQREGLILFAASEGGQEEFLALQIRAGRPWFLYDPQGCRTYVTVDLHDDFEDVMFDENGRLRENVTFNGVTYDDGKWHHLVAKRRVNDASISVDGNSIGCAAIVTTTDDEGLPYNDYRWHHLRATRNDKQGYIVLDGRWTGEKESTCSTGNIIGRNTGVYLGGLPEDYIIQRTETDDRAQVNSQNFQGCIRDVKILTQVAPEEVWTPLNWTTVVERFSAAPNWEGCPDNLESQPAAHFLGTGYMSYKNAFPLERTNNRITPQWEFEMRTERQDGMLIFGWGITGTYHLIQLVSGNIQWIYSTIYQTKMVTFPNTTLNLCDGQWHHVHFQKKGGQVEIQVDFTYNVNADDNEPLKIENLIEIASAMYMGGIPNSEEAKKALVDNNIESIIEPNFGGCVRYLKVDRKDVRTYDEALDVYLDGCPARGINNPTCQPTLLEVVYNGTGNITYDYGLDSFTEYIYQVEAVSVAGSSVGPWETGRTREGPPEGVSGPYNVQVVTGFNINAQWLAPTGYTGQITSYFLRAYDRDNFTAEPAEMEFPASTLTGQMTNAVPYTNYTLHLVACTAGGCTESSESVDLFTMEEAPGGVAPPIILDQGGSYLYLGWAPPQSPNGVLTGYALYRDDQEIYAGNEFSFNVTGLNIYNSYRFYLKVCSRVGCTDSDIVSLATRQLPPTSVSPPSLTVLGTSVIQAEWLGPEQPNGILERYILYASTDALQLGQAVYNSTVLVLFYNIPELIPGSIYYIRLAACTGGGCTVSDATAATTFESAPEGVPDPVIEALSPSVLQVTWGVPLSPNGLITRYRLFQNGLIIFENPSIRQYTVSNLLPWSLHLFRVEACTTQGCSSSTEVSARTLEAPPVGTIGLNLEVLSARSVRVIWNGVTQQNGIVFYDVFFEGLFYLDPDMYDYRTVTERRNMLQSQESDRYQVIEGLIPYSVYYVQVNASNTAGFILSNSRQASMPQGSPDGVLRPIVVSPSPTTVQIDWQPVARTNAEVNPTFQLQFKETMPGAPIIDLFTQPTTSNTYLKTGLRPFVEYEFCVVAINPYGSTPSEWVSVVTRQDKPEGVDPPRPLNIGSRTVDLEWDPPLESNGIIMEYKIYKNTVYQLSTSGNETSVTVEELLPYSVYTFQVAACTLAGCTTSASSRQITTLQAVPQGLQAPSLVSQTPTSVLIVWSEPEYTNGVILQYGIERRLLGEDTITLVKTFLVNDPKQYVDRSAAIMPYTAYEYRITAETNIGRSIGPWATITTKASRPGGVQAPVVQILGPTSLYIEWSPPIQPNGRLESYILALPEPRFEIRDISQTNLTVTDLIPYTNYSVTVTACSEGGCTESQPTHISTSPAPPVGQPAPVGTPHSQSYISILWQPPAQLNGPNLRYELSRMKIRQPLDSNAIGFGTWGSLYLGPNTYFDDRGLTMFTTYQYRVTVYNDFGHTISEVSEEVTTFGGTPTKGAVVSLTPINHTSFLVLWTPPTVQELQGSVARYFVNVTDILTFTQRFEVDSDETSLTVTDLTPNTRYQITITIETHGGQTIASDPGFLTTADGAPEGLSPPVKLVINQTAVRISWSAPVSPNGEVTGYYLYKDGIRIDTQQTTPGSYILTGLQPYTVYRVQVEVCTIFACIRSVEINVTTAESIPAGVTPPSLAVQGPTVLMAIWTPPQQANGVILRYELKRKIKVPCSQLEETEPDQPIGKCTYLECGVLESFCGDACYSGPKTCCEGVVYDNIQGYECCGTSYIPRRTNPDDVCCGGNFYTKTDNFVCCGSRYVELGAGEICCPDLTQDRLDIGVGDTCCGSIPFLSNSSQLCCNGMLYARYGQQCCGDRVVADDLVCCGNDTSGQAFSGNISNTCCGSEYVQTDVTTCCGDSAGNYKVHFYPSPETKVSANDKCCGTERISTSLNCCNGNGFNPSSQACADVSSMESDCGSGVVCPITQEATAYCNRCNFDRGSHKCGTYGAPSPGQQDTGSSAGGPNEQEGEMCMTDPVKIYTGMDLRFTDENLTPFTEYHYALVVVNGAGSTSSDYTFATTSQALPEGVNPPEAEVIPAQLDTIYLSWPPPAKPNGAIVAYVLYRDGIEIFRDPQVRQYRDNNAILPYQTYTYRLRVCNGAGCVESEGTQVATLQAKPEQVVPPTVIAESSTALRLQWSPPGRPNGQISMYILYESMLQEIIDTLGSGIRDYYLSGLKPYTSYTFILSACTESGCTNSSASTGRTLQDTPQGVPPPRVVIADYNTAELYWSEPLMPNGVLTSYRLYRSSDSSTYFQIYSGLDLSFIDRPLTPSAMYWYKIQAQTIAGATNSTTVSIEIPQITPLSIPAPRNVTVLGPRKIYVEFDPPGIPNGAIDEYRVILNAGSPDEISKGFGLSRRGEIELLTPYTTYSVRVMACISGIPKACGVGPSVSVRTFEATPEGQRPPTLLAQGPTTIKITWKPPEQPNGIITSYRIQRRQVGINLEVLIANIAANTLEFVNNAPELTPYTEYEYRVIAANSQGDSASDWVRVRTLEATPVDIGAVNLEAIGAYSVTLSWRPPRLPNGVITTYIIEYRKYISVPGSGDRIQHVTVPSDVLGTSISGLSPYTAYEIRISAVNSAGSASSSWAVATTSQAAPADVGPFRVETMSNGESVILRWDQPGQPNGIINNYLIYEDGNINAIYQGLNREFEFRRLKPYTVYRIQLEACTLGGCGRSSMQDITTAETSPSNQPAPTLGHVNSTSVTLKWVPPISANGRISMYEVLRQQGGSRQKRQVTEPVAIYTTTDTDKEEYEYTDTDIEAYSVYHYQIRASNSIGSTLSDPLRVETPPGSPTGLAAPRVSQIPNRHDELSITWTPPDKVNGILRDYQLRRNSSTPWQIGPDEPREYRDTGLQPHTVYSYTVTACSQGGCTTSPPTTMITPQASPFSVEPPSLISLNETSIRVTWTEPQVLNGQITQYRLIIDDSTEYRGLALFFVATELEPFRAYTFIITACTSGGCTNSSSVIGRTNEARPAGMQSPLLRVTSSTSIEITWQPPTQPNGIITSYEVRRDGVLIDTTDGLRYVDYQVEPGNTYSYTVTAYNSQGSATSPSVSATTYSSSPIGLSPPELEPLSATSIRATWSPPLNPNGIIENYTLYRGTFKAYTGLQLTTVVRNLTYWTEFTFRVQACTLRGCATSEPETVRTLEAIPQGLAAPTLLALADIDGVHNGVNVTWLPPTQPNGIITRYEAYRRLFQGASSSGAGDLIYSGTRLTYLDQDPFLKPYTRYHYRVQAYNSEGQVSSSWQQITTLEAPPQGVLAPTIKSKTATTITVDLREPESSNGNINEYKIYVNGELRAQRLSLLQTIGDTDPLSPNTMYIINMAACNAAGCTPSSSVNTTTLSAPPESFAPPTIFNITQTSLDVYWEPPLRPNGRIIAYEVSYRMICPYPYSDGDDDVTIDCEQTPWDTRFRGLSLSTRIFSLRSYTRYEVRVVMENDMGSISATAQAVTRPAIPQYSGQPFKVRASGGSLLLDWTDSFFINGEVDNFVLYKNGSIEYSGTATLHSILRDSINAIYEFKVILFTDQGQAETPRMVFDPKGGVIVNNSSSPDPVPSSTTATPQPVSSMPVYQEVWFIVFMAILALILLAIGITLCFCCTNRHKRPYIREKMPLSPRQRKAHAPLAYVMDPYDTSMMATELPVLTPAHEIHTTPAHMGYINPAYSHLSVPSRPASLLDLNLDRISHKSSRFDDEESIWDGQIPMGHDSGLHSLAYGDDYDIDSDRPISVLKEHTMFTDTHL